MSYLTEADVARLQAYAYDIRCTVLAMLAEAGSGHTAGSLGMADIFSAFYFHVLNHDPADPEREDRDRLILSNGHIAPVRYAAMAHAGYFPLEETLTLRRFGSRLQGHPERTHLPGLETTSGPLGDGLTQAAGMALAYRMDNNPGRIYAVMSDGEQQCGITWEAAMFAGARGLSNLTAVIDRNHIQISGTTEEVLAIEPLAEKYEAFNWNVLLVDGHTIDMFIDAIETAKGIEDKPTVIIATTIPGKGVPEIEGDHTWHGKVPTKEQAERWIAALERAREEIGATL
jgi:transketolase